MSDQVLDVLPRLEVLTREQIEHIHTHSLEILSSVGMRVDSAKARDIFVNAGCTSNSDNTIRIPAELVSWALQTSPSYVDVYNRLGHHVCRLGGLPRSQTRFGVGVTNLYYQDPATDLVEPFNRIHMAIGTRLSESLSNFDFVSTIGVLQDISPDVADLFGTLEMVANTVKPLVALISEEKCFPAMLEQIEHGGEAFFFGN